MNNPNLKTFANFTPTRQLSRDQPNNHSGHCHTRIQKRLPFWINNQPFWTYQCPCCQVYKFEKGKTTQAWGGIYE